MSKREKFTTRSIILRTEQQRILAHAALDNAPLDTDKPLEFCIRELPKVRGLDANGYYFMRVGEIASQAWLLGRQYNTDVWHEYLKERVMPDEITNKSGAVRSKWIDRPDGKLTVISTTQLEKGCFAEYTELVEAFGSSLGVMFKANPKDAR